MNSLAPPILLHPWLITTSELYIPSPLYPYQSSVSPSTYFNHFLHQFAFSPHKSWHPIFLSAFARFSVRHTGSAEEIASKDRFWKSNIGTARSQGHINSFRARVGSLSNEMALPCPRKTFLSESSTAKSCIAIFSSPK